MLLPSNATARQVKPRMLCNANAKNYFFSIKGSWTKKKERRRKKRAGLRAVAGNAQQLKFINK